MEVEETKGDVKPVDNKKTFILEKESELRIEVDGENSVAFKVCSSHFHFLVTTSFLLAVIALCIQ